MININQLSKSYCLDKTVKSVLKNINLTIPQGGIFGIIGRSGAGKSTLLRTINYLESPTTGEVLVDGTNLDQLSVKQLRTYQQQVGMIFQQFNLLSSRTVYENIALPLVLQGVATPSIDAKVTELLQLVGLTDRKDYYPEHLSGGQKQRVAIARALATEPKILLCDEATSALDTESTHNVLALLQKINKLLGLTIVLVTHELDVVKRICQQVAVLHNGELLETSSVYSLFTQPQHQLTQSLLFQTQSNPDMGIEKTLNSECVRLIKLNFVGKDSELPFISQLIKQFAVDINIKQAKIEIVSGKTIGFTLCEVIAETPEQLTQALAFIEQSSVQAEVLTYA